MILRKKPRGLTLVEVMIVVAIIALLAAIAIPNLLRAHHNANESAAIGVMHTLSAALESFRAAQTPPTYPTTDLTELSGATPPYIADSLADGTNQGYTFTYTPVDANQYDLVASPDVVNVTGTRDFFVDETGTIRSGTDETGDPLE